jgi:hypothetical protein
MTENFGLAIIIRPVFAQGFNVNYTVGKRTYLTSFEIQDGILKYLDSERVDEFSILSVAHEIHGYTDRLFDNFKLM